MASLQLAFDILAKDRASAEFRKVGDAADDVGKRSGKLGGLFAGIGGAVAAGGAIAGTALVALGVSSIAAASDLEQVNMKVKNVFGPAATGIVQAFAKDAATSFGISRTAALEAAGTFGTFFSQLGFTQTEAAKSSQKIIQLAADLGSFNNLPTAEVLDAINSSLRGEFDTLQRLVPTINAAAVETEALNASGKKSASQLTEQDKATATLALITKGATLAQGDFAESSDTLANRQQVLRAKFDDAKTALGTALLPAATAVAGYFTNTFVPAMERLGQEFKNGTGTGGQLREAFEKVKQTVIDNMPEIKKLGSALLDIGVFITSTVVPVLVDLYATRIVLLVKAFETVKTVMLGVTDFALTMTNGFLTGFGLIFSVLAKIPGPFQDNFRAASVAVTAAKGTVTDLKAAIDLASKPKTAKISADVAGAKSDIDSVGARIARLKDKTVTITTVERTIIEREGRQATDRGQTERASGGSFIAGRPYLVGERGPELVMPSASGRVIPSTRTAALLRADGIGSGDPELRAEVAGLRGDVRRLVRDAQTASRAMAGV